MSIDELETRIAAAYPDSPLPASPEGLRRVLGRRARGDRVRLSDRPDPGYWRYGLLAAAVIAGLLLFPRAFGRDPESDRGDNPVGRLAQEALMPAQLLAQGSSRPAYPPATLDLRRDIQPGEWTYAILRGSDQFSDSTMLSRIRLSQSEYNGKPAWLALSRMARGTLRREWKDSTWVDRSTLDLLGRSIVVFDGKTRWLEEYRQTEILTGLVTPNGTTWAVIPVDTAGDDPSNGISLYSELFMMMLKRAPLNRDWRGSIQLISAPNGGTAAKRWYDLSVVGDDRVVVPAGTFECWKIRFGPPSVRSDRGFFYWVSKDQQWIIQQGSDSGPGPKFLFVLVNAREGED